MGGSPRRPSGRQPGSGSHADAEPTTADGRTERREKRQAALAYNTNGLGHLKSGQYAKAAELFTQALALHPDNARYFFSRANCYRNLADNSRCVFDYSMAIRLDGDVAVYYANRGTIYRKLGRLDEAQSDLNKAVSLDPQNPTFCFNRALVRADMGKVRAAADDFTAAISLSTDGQHTGQTTKAHFHRGVLQHQLGLFEEAAADQRVVLRADRNNAPSLNALGMALAALGESSEALALFDQAMRLDLRTPAYPANRANAFRALARFTEALSDLAQAISLSPSDAGLRAQLGETKLDCGQFDAAAAYEHAVRLDDSNPTFRLAYGRSLYLLGDLANARAQVEAAISVDPLFAKAHYQLGLVAYQGGRYADALVSLERAAALDPSSDAPLIATAAVLLDTAKAADALARLDRAVTLEQSSVRSRLLRGRALLTLGQAEAALDDLELAIAIEADEAATRKARSQHAEQAALLAQGTAGTSADEKRRRGVQADAESAAKDTAAKSDREEAGGRRARADPDPLRAECYGQRALVLHALGENARALADLDYALDVSPDDARWLEARALCHARQANLKSAETDLDSAIACAAAAPSGATARAVAARGHANIGATIASSDASHLLAPSAAFGAHLIARLRHQRAAVRFSRESYKTSAAELVELLLAHNLPHLECTRRPAAYFLLGLCHARQGRHLAAVECLNEAVAARPDVTVYRHERAKALQLAHEHAAAVHDFSEVLRSQPGNARARFRRGFAHKALGHFNQAADDFEGAKLLAPRAPELVLSYARIHAIDTIELCAPGDEPDTPPLIF
ncbi:hypothetical protein T492DRAFT_635176 [Pavlovales sp. CCMP2436]|nr:hypothetical protein T492DRAFT_635176 [Pavlovales sp. CCMP2436]